VQLREVEINRGHPSRGARPDNDESNRLERIISMKCSLSNEQLQKIVVVYGEKCKSLFLALVEQADPGTNLDAILAKAVDETCEEQFIMAGAALGPFHFF
jgi:hypothetical protein